MKLQLYDVETERTADDPYAWDFQTLKEALDFVRADPRYEGHAFFVGDDLYMKQRGLLYQWTGRKFRLVDFDTL